MEGTSPLKRKAQLSSSSTESLKEGRVDPTPEAEDTTMMEDDDRVGSLPGEDSDGLSVLGLFGIDVKQTTNDLKQLQTRTDALEIAIAEQRKFFDSVRKRQLRKEKETLITFEANALLDLTRLIMKKSKIGVTAAEDSSTTELQEFAMRITHSQLTEPDIRRKIWPLLRKLDGSIRARRYMEPYGPSFAQLLLSLSPSPEDNNNDFNSRFELWNKIFPLLYGASVEEVAAQEEEMWAELKAFTNGLKVTLGMDAGS